MITLKLNITRPSFIKLTWVFNEIREFQNQQNYKKIIFQKLSRFATHEWIKYVKNTTFALFT